MKPTPEALYRLLARQVETIPQFPHDKTLTEEQHRWLAQTYALLDTQAGLGAIQFQLAQGKLGSMVSHNSGVQEITALLHQALAKAELAAPPGVQGSFIAIGQELDAYGAIGKVLGSAQNDLLIVDPYFDAAAPLEFVPLAPDSVTVRLLGDEDGVKGSFDPAVRKLKAQHAERAERLQAKLAPARSLHDRLIIVDGGEAWILTQSLKDFAARSPASISRADPEPAKLKIDHYRALWDVAVPLGV